MSGCVRRALLHKSSCRQVLPMRIHLKVSSFTPWLTPMRIHVKVDVTRPSIPELVMKLPCTEIAKDHVASLR